MPVILRDDDRDNAALDPGSARNGSRPTVGVVIPVFNEEAAIGHVVAAIPRSVVSEIIVVDGGSRDRTAEVASAAGARVIVERRRGYGRACATGAVASTTDIIVFLDGDGSDDGAQVPNLAESVRRGEADVMLGSRTNVRDGAMPAFARVGNVFAARAISLLWGQRVTDLASFKAIRRNDLIALGMTEATYGWTIELIVKAARHNLRIREIPLTYYRRIGGESKVSGNLRASAKAACAILWVLTRHALGRADVGVAGRVPLIDEST